MISYREHTSYRIVRVSYHIVYQVFRFLSCLRVSKDFLNSLRILGFSQDSLVLEFCQDCLVLEFCQDSWVLEFCQDSLVLEFCQESLVLELSQYSLCYYFSSTPTV
jgi:hypothetical protein